MPSPAARTFQELLSAAEKIDRITIEVENPGRFVWRLYNGDKEVVSAAGKPSDVPSMLISTEHLVNAVMGIAETALYRHHPTLN